MLLRTSSSSILKPSSSSSWITRFNDLISEPDPFLHLLGSKSVPKTTSLSLSDDDGSPNKKKKKGPLTRTQPDKNKTQLPHRVLGTNQVLPGTDSGLATGGEVPDSDHTIDRARAYYDQMIEANPGNSLLLGNYAKFLKESVGDLGKAEEYCERAILRNPTDANVLSMYGDIIWETHKDAERAQTYFDRAVKVAPQDCHVLASYARFLWDLEDGDEGEEREQ